MKDPAGARDCCPTQHSRFVQVVRFAQLWGKCPVNAVTCKNSRTPRERPISCARVSLPMPCSGRARVSHARDLRQSCAILRRSVWAVELSRLSDLRGLSELLAGRDVLGRLLKSLDKRARMCHARRVRAHPPRELGEVVTFSNHYRKVSAYPLESTSETSTMSY